MNALFQLMNGKKTGTGAFLIALGTFFTAIGKPQYGEPLNSFGQALAVFGIGHKIDKAASQ